MGRVDGKVALISGTASGQGQAAALLFARQGAIVVGCDIDVDGAEKTVQLARDEGLTMDLVAPIDLTDRADVTRWIEHADKRHGGVDILYNNASRQVFAPFAEMTVEDYNFTIANEIDLVWHACQIAWPYLAKRNGTIVNIASIAGLLGSRELPEAAHVVTKGAVIAFTRQLAAEGAAVGIRANCISPGVIASPPVQAIFDAMGEDSPSMSMVRRTAAGRMGRPIDVAYAALYLASDEASWVTGTNLIVDGGTTALV
jgi:meso-butanediol dehydrogenase/(S,S)-butanediol dehydrogenase/diacetyl reductase